MAKDANQAQVALKQARTLRLMAHCLLSTGDNNRAKQCAQLASEVFERHAFMKSSSDTHLLALRQMQENHSVLFLLAKLNFVEGCFDVAEQHLAKLLAHSDTNTLDMYGR